MSGIQIVLIVIGIADFIDNYHMIMGWTDRCDITHLDSLEHGRSWVQVYGRVKPKTIKLVFVPSSLSTNHLGDRANLGIRIMRLSVMSGIQIVLIVIGIADFIDNYHMIMGWFYYV
jgi:hypothetical protein